jgi:hypothetical protein
MKIFSHKLQICLTELWNPCLSSPGAFQFDAAVSRKFSLTEAKQLQLRFEAFNVLNHSNLGNAVSSENSANFGLIQSQVGDGRTFQGAVKFLF